jgi:hypothetical protein
MMVGNIYMCIYECEMRGDLFNISFNEINEAIFEAISAQYNLFDEPDIKEVKPKKRDRRIDTQMETEKEERRHRKALEREKKIEDKFKRHGLVQSELQFEMLSKRIDKIIKENIRKYLSTL